MFKEWCTSCNIDAIHLAESDYFEYSKSIAKVNIILTDLNDNAPIFHQSFYQYELEDVSASTLLNVTASDPDEGINADFDFGYGGVTRVSEGYDGKVKLMSL